MITNIFKMIKMQTHRYCYTGTDRGQRQCQVLFIILYSFCRSEINYLAVGLIKENLIFILFVKSHPIKLYV